MPLPKQFHAFFDGRIVRVNITEQDLGSQENLIRSLNQRALIRVPEIDLPEFDSFFKTPIKLKIRKSLESEPEDQELTILDPARRIKVALSETNFTAAFPLKLLPYTSHFLPTQLTDKTGKNIRVLRPVGRADDLTLNHTPHLPMPENTWLFINLTGEKKYALQSIYMEIHDGKTVRVPKMNNVFDNGGVCTGNIGIGDQGIAKQSNKPRRDFLMEIFKEFLNSMWNDHLPKNEIIHWIRWDMNFNYIRPTTPMSSWTYTAGSSFSIFAQ